MPLGDSHLLGEGAEPCLVRQIPPLSFPTTLWALAVGFRLTRFPLFEICLQSPSNSLGDAVGCRRQHCLPSLFNSTVQYLNR